MSKFRNKPVFILVGIAAPIYAEARGAGMEPEVACQVTARALMGRDVPKHRAMEAADLARSRAGE